MDNQDFFIHTINDIKEKKIKGDEYSMIRSCGLLRHLLLDNPTLISRANKPFGLKIKFTVDDYKTPTLAFPIIYQMDIDFIHNKTRVLSLSPFLSLVCFQIWQYEYKVSDIIQTGAHIKGGIHSSDADSEKMKFITDIDKLTFRNKNMYLRSIDSICNVVIHGTTDLYNKITRHTTADGF